MNAKMRISQIRHKVTATARHCIRKCRPGACNAAVSNEKGIALVMILLLAAIALTIIAALIYMVTSGSQISGMEKRYKTALEAGIGGADVTYQLIAARADPAIPLDGWNLALSATCLADKLNFSTEDWDPTCSNTATVGPSSYDMTFTLGTSPYPTYTVYSKIVDTIEGNSGGDEGLLGKGVIASGTGEVTVVHRPYLYRIEIDSENAANPAERAKLSILYQY